MAYRFNISGLLSRWLWVRVPPDPPFLLFTSLVLFNMSWGISHNTYDTVKMKKAESQKRSSWPQCIKIGRATVKIYSSKFLLVNEVIESNL